MKSIEERANECALNHGITYNGRRCIAIGYEYGAADQRAIDIEKAAAWWESRCDYLGISKFQIELFKKAMEE